MFRFAKEILKCKKRKTKERHPTSIHMCAPPIRCPNGKWQTRRQKRNGEECKRTKTTYNRVALFSRKFESNYKFKPFNKIRISQPRAARAHGKLHVSIVFICFRACISHATALLASKRGEKERTHFVQSIPFKCNWIIELSNHSVDCIPKWERLESIHPVGLNCLFVAGNWPNLVM